MAGTRLALISVYAIQIILLFTYSFYRTIEDSYSKNQSSWSRTHHPFITDRRGLSSRFTGNSGDDGSISSVLNQISADLFDMNQVQFYIINHHGTMDPVKKEEEDTMLHETLQRGLDQYLNSKSSKIHTDSSSTNSNVIASPYTSVKYLDKDDYSNTHIMACNDINLQNLPESDNLKNKDSRQFFAYHIHVVFDCKEEEENDEVQQQKVKMEINEFGSMIIRFTKDMSIEEIKYTIQHPVSKYLATWLLPPSTTNILSFSSINVISTLVDSNPVSHVSSPTPTPSAEKNRFGPIDHHQLLSAIFRNKMDESIVPLVQTAAEVLYKSTHLEHHGVTFVGQDVVLNSFYSEYDDEDIPNDYTLSIEDGMDIIWNGEVGNAINLPVSRVHSYDKEGKQQGDEVVWNLVFYVPPATFTPLFFQKSTNVEDYDNSVPSWSQAFAIPSKNTIVSIVNINHEKYSNDDHEDSKAERESVYRSAIQRSISYTGSYMRKRFGLPSIPYNMIGIQGHGDDQSGKIFVEYHYATPTSFGISPWEVDSLLRQSWSVKVGKAIQIIESMIDLLSSRNMVAFPFEVANRFEDCIQHLKDSTDKNNNISILERFEKLNNALEEAKGLAEDEEIFELPFVSYDQLFAIFGSMIFPLLAPMIKNFSSEVSRFRKLSKKVKID